MKKEAIVKTLVFTGLLTNIHLDEDFSHDELTVEVINVNNKGELIKVMKYFQCDWLDRVKRAEITINIYDYVEEA